ncbi:hypothetical protein ACMZOO_17925 (plasmid) [Catenovulum sp. SX2]|uniref:hypothetical protein n=1 Tax=Catenovulum sp. SX2 TaxID=3398614 RepID=UPI003F873434
MKNTIIFSTLVGLLLVGCNDSTENNNDEFEGTWVGTKVTELNNSFDNFIATGSSSANIVLVIRKNSDNQLEIANCLSSFEQIELTANTFELGEIQYTLKSDISISGRYLKDEIENNGDRYYTSATVELTKYSDSIEAFGEMNIDWINPEHHQTNSGIYCVEFGTSSLDTTNGHSLSEQYVYTSDGQSSSRFTQRTGAQNRMHIYVQSGDNSLWDFDDSSNVDKFSLDIDEVNATNLDVYFTLEKSGLTTQPIGEASGTLKIDLQ